MFSAIHRQRSRLRSFLRGLGGHVRPYGQLLHCSRRLDQSESSRQLDPMSLIIAADRGVILYYARQYDPAIEQLKAVLDMEPSFARARMLENAYIQKRMFAEALTDAESWERSGNNAWRVATLGYLYGKTNQRAKALECLSELQKQ